METEGGVEMKSYPTSWERKYTPGSSKTVSSFMTRTFSWMFLGLMVTGLVSYFTTTSPVLLETMTTGSTRFILMLAELGLVVWLSSMIRTMSAETAIFAFLSFSALNGLSLSLLFVIYTASSLAQIFFIAAGAFGGLALFGAVTKKDLSGMGNFCIMGLMGMIALTLVNIFVKSAALDLSLSLAGILIFSGLTAYDTNQIRSIGHSLLASGELDEATLTKTAIFGALTLYLDFINLFLELARVFGRRRD